MGYRQEAMGKRQKTTKKEGFGLKPIAYSLLFMAFCQTIKSWNPFLPIFHSFFSYCLSPLAYCRA
jgi:hypothetical protein